MFNFSIDCTCLSVSRRNAVGENSKIKPQLLSLLQCVSLSFSIPFLWSFFSNEKCYKLSKYIRNSSAKPRTNTASYLSEVLHYNCYISFPIQNGHKAYCSIECKRIRNITVCIYCIRALEKNTNKLHLFKLESTL